MASSRAFLPIDTGLSWLRDLRQRFSGGVPVAPVADRLLPGEAIAIRFATLRRALVGIFSSAFPSISEFVVALRVYQVANAGHGDHTNNHSIIANDYYSK